MLMKINKLLLVLLICAVLVSHFAAVSPVKAVDFLDLVIDEGLIVPWEINNIVPGSSGVVPVDIRNAGNINGYVAVWIDSVIDMEGENPEAETGNTDEPGEISQYLTLSISGEDIAPYTTAPGFELPVALYQFPGDSIYPLQLSDQPLEPGVTIQVLWEWAVPPQTSNIIQGDHVSFNINYVLTSNLIVQKPSTPIFPVSGGGQWLEDTPDSDMEDDDSEEIEDITDSDVEVGEEDKKDTSTTDVSDNTIIFDSEETDMADDFAGVPPSFMDDNLKPALAGSEGSQSTTDIKSVTSMKSEPAREILSRISLIVAISGTLAMTVIAYIERKRRNSGHKGVLTSNM